MRCSGAFMLLATAGRVVLLYAFLLVLLRLAGRRQFAELSPMDLLAMLLLSETVSPALTAGADDVPTALVAAGTLVLLTLLLDVITARSPRAERIIDGHARVLGNDGVIDEALRRRLRITEESLRAALHEHGLESIHEAKRVFVEADGSITIVPRHARPGT